MDFDPTRPLTTPRDAAAVILLRARERDGAPEVLLVRRTARASFMARAFVFPGGARDGAEDLRVTAARELFEEAGVLLADRPVAQDVVSDLRARAAAGEPPGALLAGAGLALDPGALSPFTHFVTPSAEKRRFSARFFLAELPAGQTPEVDGTEVVELRWERPQDALERAGELLLPPPQLRALWDLRGARSLDDARALVRARASHVTPLIPRYAPLPDAPGGFALLLPWDPEYETRGLGDGAALALDHPLAGGPSRFTLEGEVWRHGDAP